MGDPGLENTQARTGPTEVDGSAPGGKMRMGRYELLDELGNGGMASVHLARTRGPAGFHKWFAVKLVHPHLAKDKKFVDMFLDEARIAASVDHPNVAQVVELGEANDTYFLAMEYLHGEHLGRLTSRAVREMGHVPYRIAAHCVAEAANGLHAAHEGRDPMGRRLELVHRDVSPQNIFVNYDGRVKVTDFGVAKAANRISHTSTGTAKGKVAYMSPEQALGTGLDRRTDIFALGTVLWEITVGRRLFKAHTDAQTLMRVTSGKVKRPSSFAADYPPELERIVLKALAYKADDRYQSAAEMAHDLEGYVTASGGRVKPKVVGNLMSRLFADSKPARDNMLRAAVGHPTVAPSQNLSVDDLPVVPSELTSIPAKDEGQSQVRATAKGSQRRLWLGAAILGVMAVAGAGVGILAALSEEEEAAPPPTATAIVETNPAGAVVTLDGAPVEGRTPLTLAALAPGRHELSITQDGYEPLSTSFDAIAEERMRMSYALRPMAAEEPPEEGSADDSETDGRAEAEPAQPEAEADPAPEEAAEPRAPTRRGRGTLTVVAVPWASVRVNGASARNTPLRDLRLPAGRVTLRYQVRGQGDERVQRLRLRDGDERTVTLDTR